MKRHSFTLIELLVTVGIIAILAGILVPAVNSAIKKGESAKAKAEITALVNAIKQYENTYNKLPVANGFETKTYNSTSTKKIIYATDRALLKDLVKALQGDDTIQTAASKKVNPRKIKFMDISNAGKGEYSDPWENDYRIIMANDEEIPLDALANADDDKAKYDSTGIIYQSVVVWSAGPDGKWDTKDDVHSFNAEYEGGKWTLTN